MFIPSLLIAITENDKRFLIALLLVFVILLVFLIFICLLIEKVCKYQAKRTDKLMHDLVVVGLVTTPKQFKYIANKKNRILFYLSARIPFLLIVISLLIAIIYMGSTNNWDFVALFNNYGTKVEGTSTGYVGGTGFATILFLWDFDNIPHGVFFGMNLISDWPPLLQTPHFEVSALASYFFIPIFFTGIIWFLVESQAYIARKYRIHKLSSSIYEKNLDNVKFDDLANFKATNNGVTFVKTAPEATKKPEEAPQATDTK